MINKFFALFFVVLTCCFGAATPSPTALDRIRAITEDLDHLDAINSIPFTQDLFAFLEQMPGVDADLLTLVRSADQLQLSKIYFELYSATEHQFFMTQFQELLEFAVKKQNLEAQFILGLRLFRMKEGDARALIQKAAGKNYPPAVWLQSMMKDCGYICTGQVGLDTIKESGFERLGLNLTDEERHDKIKKYCAKRKIKCPVDRWLDDVLDLALATISKRLEYQTPILKAALALKSRTCKPRLQILQFPDIEKDGDLLDHIFIGICPANLSGYFTYERLKFLTSWAYAVFREVDFFLPNTWSYNTHRAKGLSEEEALVATEIGDKGSIEMLDRVLEELNKEKRYVFASELEKNPDYIESLIYFRNLYSRNGDFTRMCDAITDEAIGRPDYNKDFALEYFLREMPTFFHTPKLLNKRSSFNVYHRIPDGFLDFLLRDPFCSPNQGFILLKID